MAPTMQALCKAALGVAMFQSAAGLKRVKVEVSPADDTEEECADKEGVELHTAESEASKDEMEWLKKEDEWFSTHKRDADAMTLADEVDNADDMTHARDHWNKTIIFIRASQHLCQPDGGLTDVGHAQCEKVLDHWETTLKKVQRVYVSPYNRAIQTALHIFPAEKIHFNQYVMEHRGVIIKEQGRYTLENSNQTQLLGDYNELWDLAPEQIGSWSAPHFRHDPDRIMDEYASPTERWAHFIQKLRREKATNIAIITHRRIMKHMLGGKTETDFHQGEIKVAGLMWQPDGGFILQQVHPDVYYNANERVVLNPEAM